MPTDASSTTIDLPAPPDAIDPRSLEPRFGTYRGALARHDLSALHASPWDRLLREKRWIYTLLVARPWTIAIALVDLGYACTLFGFAAHAERGLVADLRSTPGLPGLSGLRQDGVSRVDARFRGVGARASMRQARGAERLELRLASKPIDLHATLDLSRGAPALSAIAPIRAGRVNVTEKRALAPVRGSARVGSERIALDGGLGGVDLTFGLLARETRWNWAFLMGETTSGEPVALNLVEGFVGQPECALFGERSLVALAEGRFELPRPRVDAPREERARTLAPWRIRTSDGAAELTFTPHAIHDEHLDLGALRSRFVQPIGRFSGTLRLADRTLRLEGVPGVVEDQDVRW